MDTGSGIPLSKLFNENRKKIESNPLKLGDDVEFPMNVYDDEGKATGEVVPNRGKVIAIRNHLQEDILLPKYIIVSYYWLGKYFKKCGPRDICRLGLYEESFEFPMRNPSTKAQISDYLLDIENEKSEECQYERKDIKAIVPGFYDSTDAYNNQPSNKPPLEITQRDIKINKFFVESSTAREYYYTCEAGSGCTSGSKQNGNQMEPYSLKSVPLIKNKPPPSKIVSKPSPSLHHPRVTNVTFPAAQRTKSIRRMSPGGADESEDE